MQIILAFQLGVGIGDYTHISGSTHLYERNAFSYAENLKESIDNDTKENIVKNG